MLDSVVTRNHCLTRCDKTIAAARANVGAAKALKMKMINEMLGSTKN
ncbi:MAG: hypothetical protein Q7U51_07300 [Methanoregula sp.]|nr:hypothetical protein [Methanoregula sp.]